MAKAKAYLGVFEHMEFPDYKFEEYPKVVGYRDKERMTPIIVNDAKEEIDFITTGGPGAVKTKEDELKAELDRKQLELDQAKMMLEELQKAKESPKEAPKAAPEKIVLEPKKA